MRRLATTLCLSAAVFIFGASPSWAASPVTLPPNYVYDPSSGSLHDYCTLSDDVHLIENRQLKKSSVDERGPCARHDLCYEGDAPKKVCDSAFYHDLLQQCDYKFGGDTTGFLDQCRTHSQTYYVGVIVGGDG